jgi:Bacterial Ig domain
MSALTTTKMGLGCLLLMLLSVEAMARCSVPRIRTLNNQAVDGRMTVSSGDSCSIRLRRSGGPTYSASIVQRPSNGTATVDAQNRIVYRSRAGFVGHDAFTYARHGESIRGNAVTRTVRIAVTVTRPR